MRSRDVGPKALRTSTQVGDRRDLIWLCAYTFLLALSVQPMNIYLPLYAYETELLSLRAAGSAVALVGAVGIVARVLAGRLASHLPAPSLLLGPLALTAGLAMACMAVASGTTIVLLAMACMAVASGTTIVLLWVGTALFAVSALSGNVVIMLTLVKRVDVARTGHASGLVSAAMFVGFATGPAAFGMMADASDSYTGAWSVVGACRVLAAVVGARIYRRRRPVVPSRP